MIGEFRQLSRCPKPIFEVVWVYNALLLLSLFYVLPKWLIQKKYRGTLAQRLGIIKPKPSTNKPIIWLHMCSVGETKAMIPIYGHLKEKYPDAAFYLSSTTKTGHEEAKRSLTNATDYFFLPLDLSWVTNTLVNHLQPNLLILSEGEFWPNIIASVKKRGGKVVLLNGKLSQKSAKRFASFSKITAHFFHSIDHFFVQSQEHATRFQTLNIPQSKISVTGNLKLFAPPTTPLTHSQKNEWREKLSLSADDFVITLASTHPGEEELLLAHIPPYAKVLVAPRHPERFSAVQKLLTDPRFVLIDQMGILPSCYQISHLAIVGGSFIPHVGGHNIFEPIQAHIPVIFGPYMETQKELVSLILENEAGIQTSIENLSENIERALSLQPHATALALATKEKGEGIIKQLLAEKPLLPYDT